jgi:pimeloyl-ACP methyl ester carboxylesterase
MRARIGRTQGILPEGISIMKKPFAHLLATAVIACLLVCTLQAQSAPAPRTTDTTVQLGSGKVFYRDSGGKGVPVIFLHAGSGNSMIAIDYRGVGAAMGGPGGGNSSTLINELVAKLALPKFHLLGTAAGGGAALQYALANRDKLRSVIISNSIGNVRDREYTEMGNRIRPAAFNQLPLEMKELGPSYRAANPEGVKRWLALSGEANDTVGPSSGGMGGGAPPGQPGGPPPGGATNDPNAVTWTNLEAFKVPTLLMTGDADLYTPPSVLRMFTARMKQAESHVVTDSGHSSFWENPDDFNRTVLAFISKY